MSVSEQTGRCRREITAAYENTRYKPSDSDMLVADAIDRLAADVAAIKAKVDAVSPEDVKHFVDSEKAWVALVTEQRDAAIRERDTAMAEVERLKAIVHSDAGHMAKILIENERLRAERAAPQPAAPAAAWLTDRERHVLSSLLSGRPRDPMLDWRDYDGVVRAILARAGSPPVVEVPALGFLGDMTGREQGIVLAYRDALDKAGVKWKEVPRE